jgi:WD40 repeat protein
MILIFPFLSNTVDSPSFSCAIGSSGTSLVASTGCDISIWDLRNTRKPVMYFDNSHSDEVTQIRFHPTQQTLFCSGGMDGLICAFDISQNNEDDAIQTILPVDHAIRKIGFLDDSVYCLTSTEQFSIWHLEEVNNINCPIVNLFFTFELISCWFLYLVYLRQKFWRYERMFKWYR